MLFWGSSEVIQGSSEVILVYTFIWTLNLVGSHHFKANFDGILTSVWGHAGVIWGHISLNFGSGIETWNHFHYQTTRRVEASQPTFCVAVFAKAANRLLMCWLHGGYRLSIPYSTRWKDLILKTPGMMTILEAGSCNLLDTCIMNGPECWRMT